MDDRAVRAIFSGDRRTFLCPSERVDPRLRRSLGGSCVAAEFRALRRAESRERASTRLFCFAKMRVYCLTWGKSGYGRSFVSLWPESGPWPRPGPPQGQEGITAARRRRLLLERHEEVRSDNNEFLAVVPFALRVARVVKSADVNPLPVPPAVPGQPPPPRRHQAVRSAVFLPPAWMWTIVPNFYCANEPVSRELSQSPRLIRHAERGAGREGEIYLVQLGSASTSRPLDRRQG